MSENTDQGHKKTLTLGKKLEVTKVAEGGQVRQSFSHGRSKTVTVEVKRKRIFMPGEQGNEPPVEDKKPLKEASEAPTTSPATPQKSEAEEKRSTTPPSKQQNGKRLTADELENRLKVVQKALKQEAMASEERKRREAEEAEWRRQMDELERSRLEEE